MTTAVSSDNYSSAEFLYHTGWRRGSQHYRVLEDWIQIGQEKFDLVIRYFGEWARERGLRAIEAFYTRRTPRGVEQLQVTADGNPEDEKFYRTHYVPADLTEPQPALFHHGINLD